jgi:uncharacterized protein YxeA
LILLKILAILLIIVGSVTVYLSKFIVDKFNLTEKIECEYEEELNAEELKDFKLNHALIRIKLIGFIIFLPGVLLTFVAFK